MHDEVQDCLVAIHLVKDLAIFSLHLVSVQHNLILLVSVQGNHLVRPFEWLDFPGNGRIMAAKAWSEEIAIGQQWFVHLFDLVEYTHEQTLVVSTRWFSQYHFDELVSSFSHCLCELEV